jgi:hypothetical protein
LGEGVLATLALPEARRGVRTLREMGLLNGLGSAAVKLLADLRRPSRVVTVDPAHGCPEGHRFGVAVE